MIPDVISSFFKDQSMQQHDFVSRRYFRKAVQEIPGFCAGSRMVLRDQNLIEAHPFTCFWMSENKRQKTAFTRVFALLTALVKDQKRAGKDADEVGLRVRRSLLEVLEKELIIKHFDRRKGNFFVDCGIAAALTALLRMDQDIEVCPFSETFTHAHAQ